VNCQLHEQRDLKHSSGLGSVSPEEILKHNPLHLVMQLTTLTTEKAFTRQFPGLSDKCVLTPALTTDVYKQHTAAFPLLTATAQ